MSRPEGSKDSRKLPPRERVFSDIGCSLYPTCLGNEEYPQCPFSVCIEDLNDPQSEMYDRETAKALLKWFKR